MAQTTEERIAQIAQGFNQGLGNYLQTSNQMRNIELQKEAQKRQQAIQALDAANSISASTGKVVDPSAVAPMIQSGNLQGLGEILKSAPLTRKAEIENKKKIDILKNSKQNDFINTKAWYKTDLNSKKCFLTKFNSFALKFLMLFQQSF